MLSLQDAQEVQNSEEDEKTATAKRNVALWDPLPQELAAEDSQTGADAVAHDGPQDHLTMKTSLKSI